MTSPIQFTRGAGGKFTGSVGGVPMPPSMVAVMRRLGAAAGGSLSFNGLTGTGYNVKGGDKRVKLLQSALNAAGFTDGQGRALDVDGKLGPLTTAAVKSAQAQLGVKTDGVVTPQLLAQIMNLPPGSAKKPAKPAMTARQAMRPAAKPAAKAAVKAAPKPAPKASPAPSEQSYQRGRVKFE